MKCGKCFRQLGHLRIHERVHTGEKRYECKQCGKSFSKSGHLRRHERVHKEEKRFRHDVGLQTHKSVHTGKKPVKCKQCGRCFSAVGILKRHERFHTREKPYECKQCGEYFHHSSALRRHNEVHSVRSLFNRLHCKAKRAGSNIMSGIHNSTLSRRKNGNCDMEILQTDIIEKHSCWVCQEEMNSEVLLQHYENHMRHVVEDGCRS